MLAESNLSPKKILEELDKYIIGQKNAKKAVAIALRNRYRRKQVEGDIQNEISPKNIIMIGSTGIGKTEIARRLAKLSNAPFIKVEATKFTEVGYVGRDVESIIRDLVATAVSDEKKNMLKEIEEKINYEIEEEILDILLPDVNNQSSDYNHPNDSKNSFSITLGVKEVKKNKERNEEDESSSFSKTREKIKKKLQAKELEEKEIEIQLKRSFQTDAMSSGGFQEINIDNINGIMKNLFDNMQNSNKKVKISIKEARKLLKDQVADKLIDMEKVVNLAINKTENMGVVFLDEIDKIASKSENKGIDVSREGVQRDILPLVEGCTINTKYGTVKTDHILFIAAGAFHMSSPSDIIPELQGRFPIRVELNALSNEDMEAILSKPKNAITKQYQALLKTEDLDLKFTDEALKKIAEIAVEVNLNNHNIGARRLFTIMEKLLEDILFEIPETNETNVFTIDEKYVKEKLSAIVKHKDLNRYIL